MKFVKSRDEYFLNWYGFWVAFKITWSECTFSEKLIVAWHMPMLLGECLVGIYPEDDDDED